MKGQMKRYSTRQVAAHASSPPSAKGKHKSSTGHQQMYCMDAQAEKQGRLAGALGQSSIIQNTNAHRANGCPSATDLICFHAYAKVVL
eukprot:939763-Pelagomonas_calceolata.AAC.2